MANEDEAKQAPDAPRCACKGQNTCLQCESTSGWSYEPFVRAEDAPSFVFCPLCRLAWPGWDGDSWRSHPRHDGRPLRYRGVHVELNVLSAGEESRLLADMDAIPWDDSQSGRRKQNFGPKTNFKRRKLKLGAFRGFPAWGRAVQARLLREPVLRDYRTIEQCSLEYRPAAGACIGPHIDDCWVWGERVVSLSLLSDCVLTMVKYTGGDERYNLADRPPPRVQPSLDDDDDDDDDDDVGGGDAVPLEWWQLPRPPTVRLPMPRRSLLVLHGAARYEWLHGILRDDVVARRVCLALREFTPAFLPGGAQERIGAEVIAIAQQFRQPPPADGDAAVADAVPQNA